MQMDFSKQWEVYACSAIKGQHQIEDIHNIDLIHLNPKLSPLPYSYIILQTLHHLHS
jgi:hypothetical protein